MLTVFVGTHTRKKGAEELAWEALQPQELAMLASTTALFGGAKTYVLTGAFAGDRAEEFLDLSKALAESPHTFVFEEEKLLKRETDILTRAGAKVEKKEKAAAGKTGFDPYGVTMALGAKDRKKLWLGLTQALRAGEKPEALAGLLAWKARQMKDANLSRQLVWMYHDSHRGAGDLELLLERFALKL
jgi:DNA polymerase III delta subunit